jgi:hypothetical protein
MTIQTQSEQSCAKKASVKGWPDTIVVRQREQTPECGTVTMHPVRRL